MSGDQFEVIKYLGTFFYKFSPNLLNGMVDKARARRKQSL